MEKWGEVGVINGRGLGDGSKRRREWDRQVSGREKERAKEKPTLKWGALKRGAQTGVWVGCPYLFQPLYYGWFILGYPSGYSDLPF